MNPENLSSNPKLQKLREDYENFRNLKNFWPLLKPLAKLFGADTEHIDSILEEGLELAEQIEEMVTIPDEFNDLFSDFGWIIFESMDVSAAKIAIEIVEKDGMEKAEEYLVNYFSPEWVEDRINWLNYIKGFQPRFDMALKALDDYKAGRYYSSVLVVLTLIDGWVNELNLVGFQRLGFFSEKSQLVAWDSISAHPKGLVKLQQVFGKSRQITRTEEITIPFRNGIMHGMDLGYDNKYVASKCWAALFAVREWAIKASRNELNPPEIEPKKELSIFEIIEQYNNSRRQLREFCQWTPRKVQIGKNIPSKGNADDFPNNSPERIVVKFLNLWIKKNYGYMAICYPPFLEMKPIIIRDQIGKLSLEDYELIEVIDILPTITDVKVKVKLLIETNNIETTYEFRVVGSGPDGKLADYCSDNMTWGIANWRQIQ